LAGPVEKRMRTGQGSQWEKGRPQPGQKGGGETSVAQTCKREERKWSLSGTSSKTTEHKEMIEAKKEGQYEGWKRNGKEYRKNDKERKDTGKKTEGDME
jgi:hypothetical protein